MATVIGFTVACGSKDSPGEDFSGYRTFRISLRYAKPAEEKAEESEGSDNGDGDSEEGNGGGNSGEDESETEKINVDIPLRGKDTPNPPNQGENTDNLGADTDEVARSAWIIFWNCFWAD